MENKKSEKASFVQRVMDAITGGDEAKIKRFHRKAVKHAENQIRLNKEEIERKNEAIEDLKEAYEDDLLKVDVDKIQKADQTDEYMKVYFATLANTQRKVENARKDIEKCDEQIEYYNKILYSLK